MALDDNSRSRDLSVEEVRFQSGCVSLAGTLTLPQSTSKTAWPAVILISGSGHHDRDETVCGKKPFAVIARHLASNGIASLRYDDRGVGQSGGRADQATFESSVDDLLAAWRYLAGEPRIRVAEIVLLGHSEGGLAAADASTRTGAPVIMLAGPAIPIEQLLHWQAWQVSSERGATQAQIQHERQMNERVFELARSSDPHDVILPRITGIIADALSSWPGYAWPSGVSLAGTAQEMASIVAGPDYRSLLRQNPAIILSSVRAPILALYGELDRQVEPNANQAAFLLATAGNPNAATDILSGVNHLFQRAHTGSLDEYETLGQSPAPEVLDRMVKWLRARLS